MLVLLMHPSAYTEVIWGMYDCLNNMDLQCNINVVKFSEQNWREETNYENAYFSSTNSSTAFSFAALRTPVMVPPARPAE